MTDDVLAVPTLATMLARAAASSLPELRKREIAAAIATFCRVCRVEAHIQQATAVELQKLMRAALPAAVRVTASRWRNVMSLIRTGMKLIDPQAFPARLKMRMAPSWAALLDESARISVRRPLSRFARWACLNGIEPTDVCDAVLDRFGEALAAHCILRNPREAQQTAGNAWNDGRANVPGWPDVVLRIPDCRRTPSLAWSAFPASLGEDAEAFCAACGHDDDDLETNWVPLRPSTIAGFRTKLRRIMTAIVESGVPPERLSTLADMVQPAHARAALELMRRRAGVKTNGDLHRLAQLIVSVARHYVRVADADLKKLVGYCHKLKPKKHTLTSKNRTRLGQFDDDRQMDRYLLLPDRLMHAANGIREPTSTEALLAQDAVLLSILHYVPIRISNIAALELGRTLLLAERTGQIVLGRDEVKNDVDIHMPLPSRLVDLIRQYLKKYHPLLAPPGCPMLFPNRKGGHKLSTTLGNQISVRVRKDCGIEFNPHLTRHLAAKMMLQDNPNAYGTVMQLLHHKQIQTTIDAYCGTESEANARRYTAIVEGRRASIGTERKK